MCVQIGDIDAPSLEYLKILCSKIPVDLLIDSLYSVIQAEIGLYLSAISDEIPNGSGHTALKLLRGLVHVKRLTLMGKIAKVSFWYFLVQLLWKISLVVSITLTCKWYFCPDLLPWISKGGCCSDVSKFNQAADSSYQVRQLVFAAERTWKLE